MYSKRRDIRSVSVRICENVCAYACMYGLECVCECARARTCVCGQMDEWMDR